MMVRQRPTLESDVISMDEAAQLLGVCRRSVERRIAEGEIPRPIKIGRRSMLLLQDLQDYIAGQRRKRSV